jgi:hypothetical protein
MYTQYLTIFTLLHPFPTPLTGTNPLTPGQDLFHPPVLSFCRRKKKRKKMVFLLI